MSFLFGANKVSQDYEAVISINEKLAFYLSRRKNAMDLTLNKCSLFKYIDPIND